MVQREVDIGGTGAAVAENVTRFRGDMSYTQLSRRLEERAGWSINAVGIRRIESGERRVTVDDLMALAVALDVSPITLLLPGFVDADDRIEVSGVAEEITARRAWDWFRAWETWDRRRSIEYFLAAWPGWFQEEHLAEKLQQFKREQGEHIRRRRAEKKAAADGDD